MRQPRLQGCGSSYYHCLAEALPGLVPFDDRDRTAFAANLERMERFSGVEVVTWSMGESRIRLLVFVPDPSEISGAELERRLRDYYPETEAAERIAELRRLRRRKDRAAWADCRDGYLRRMGDLAGFLKTLLQMLTQAYNPRHRRRGTLFCQRFRSVLVEGWGPALLHLAAYVDLEPLRQGLVDDPRTWRHGGYGPAARRAGRARDRLLRLAPHLGLDPDDWRGLHQRYQAILYPDPPLSRADIRRELRQRSPRLPIPVLLRCHLRYFDYGAILGRPEFIEQVFHGNPGIFPADRRRISYRMRFGDWKGMHSFRNPVSDLVTIPAGLP